MKRRLLTFICLIILICPSVRGQSSSQSSSVVIPEGTEIQLSLRDPLSSKLSEVGDEVLATVRRDVVADGRTLLREGTEIVGRVTIAKPARRPFKGGMLHITFERVRLDGREQRLSAIIKSASDFTRDEKIKSDSEGTLKGGASGGDILKNVGTAASIGGIGATIIILSSADREAAGGVGRGVGISRGGAVAGASVLGASVVAGLLLTKGKEVRLDQGTIVRLRLERPLTLE
jgi:hypothetical protein